MTCIVGVQENGKVVLGGDSALVGGYEISQIGQPKVFKNGKFIIGGAGSARMLNLLRYKFEPSEPDGVLHIMEHMVRHFIEELRPVFREGGITILHEDYGETFPGLFLIGYKEHLMCVEGDFQVHSSPDDFMAIGISQEIARGSLDATAGIAYTAKERCEIALETSARFNGGVCPPFFYVST